MAATATDNKKKDVDQNSSWFALAKQAAKEWSDDDTATWAAAVACYTLLALAPLLVLAIKFASVFLMGKVGPDTVQNQASALMGSTAGQAIAEIVKKAAQPGSGRTATIVSIILAIVSAGGVFSELQRAMNRIWKVKPKPGRALLAWIWARAMSIIVVAAAVALVVASVVATTWIGKLTASIGLKWKYLTLGIDVVASLVVLTLLFALVYRTLPDARIQWRTTWVGAIISAVLFELGKYGLAIYFKYASPASAFGAVGSLAAVLVWIYYSCMIVFYGAEFTQVYAKARGHGVLPSPHAQALSECDETETATPSSENPGDKPQRPVADRDAPSPAPRAVPEPVLVGQSGGSSYLKAGAALVAGVVLGGLSAAKMRDSTHPTSREIAAAHLNHRLRRVEGKMTRISRLGYRPEAKAVEQRIKDVEFRIRQGQRQLRKQTRRHDATWASRVIDAMKQYV